MTACHCSGFMRMMRVSRVMPALLTRMSTVPHLSTASLISLRRRRKLFRAAACKPWTPGCLAELRLWWAPLEEGLGAPYLANKP